LKKILDDDLPEVEGNFANLGQVFINIIGNAIQSIPDEEGRISLVTWHEKDKDIIHIECRDTGKGMSPDEMRDAFKPFFTTKNRVRGQALACISPMKS